MADSAETSRRWVAIQRNPRSGTGKNRSMVIDLVTELRRLGFSPRIFKDRARLAAWVTQRQVEGDLECIVAAGGDGTFSDVFNRYPGVPVAILPLGTENLMARFLSIPSSGAAVARLIAARSRRRFDLGLVGDRRFALMVSAGFDAEIVRQTHAARRGHISHAAYLQPILDSLRSYDHPALRVTVDQAEGPLTARLAVVVNIPAYALGLSMAQGARGDDGLLDVRLFEQGSAFQMVRYFYNLTLGTHERLPDVFSKRAKRVRIESDRPVPLQADGDPAGFTPAEISLLPGAIEVYAPRHEAERQN